MRPTRGVMESGWYVLGKEVEAFEAEYAAFCGTRHCVGLGNGLEGAGSWCSRAWNIGAGDEVIVPSNTYIATLACGDGGGRQGSCRSSRHTQRPQTIDPERLAAAITARTRGDHGRSISMASPPTWMRSWRLADKHGLKVVEDVAQAQGLESARGRRAGSIGAGPARIASFRPRTSAPTATAARSRPTIPPWADRLRAPAQLRQQGEVRERPRRGFNSTPWTSCRPRFLRVKLKHPRPLETDSAVRSPARLRRQARWHSRSWTAASAANGQSPCGISMWCARPRRADLVKAMEKAGIGPRLIHYSDFRRTCRKPMPTLGLPKGTFSASPRHWPRRC